MKRPVNTTLASIILLTGLAVGLTISIVEYDPWADYNDDGYVGIDDIIAVAERFGGEGTLTKKASLIYDSGWINITSQQGEYFDVTHNLNITNLNSEGLILDVKGKTNMTNETLLRLGSTDHIAISGFDWNQTYGGSGFEEAYAVVQTGDGGYLTAGYSTSYGAGMGDFWLVKIDSSGNEQWSQTYGGADVDIARSVVQTGDGGYAIVGYTCSYGVGEYDFWLVKTNSTGHELWNQTYGGTGTDYGISVVQTGDGGYAIAGSTYSFGAGVSDFWLVKTDSVGVMQWSHTYGGLSWDDAYALVQTSDGGYIIAGRTSSYGAGEYDFWLVKTDSVGVMQWSHTYGGPYRDEAWAVVQTGDSGYAIAGSIDPYGEGFGDFWLVKTDSVGVMQWSHTYGGTNHEYAYAVVQTDDGGYAIAGRTDSFGAGNGDFWLVKTDALGHLLWSRTYGGTYFDIAFTLVETNDNGYILAGYTSSYGAGEYDFWLVKTGIELNFSVELLLTEFTSTTIWFYRDSTDPYWNYINVCIWEIRETP